MITRGCACAVVTGGVAKTVWGVLVFANNGAWMGIVPCRAAHADSGRQHRTKLSPSLARGFDDFIACIAASITDSTPEQDAAIRKRVPERSFGCVLSPTECS